MFVPGWTVRLPSQQRVGGAQNKGEYAHISKTFSVTHRDVGGSYKPFVSVFVGVLCGSITETINAQSKGTYWVGLPGMDRAE